MSVETNKKALEIREKEIQARSLVADIVPMLDQIPEEAVGEVVEHLEQALETCKKKVEEARSDKKVEPVKR